MVDSGSCGSCDDGDSCMADYCIEGYICGYILLLSCFCIFVCGKLDGRLSYVHMLWCGIGGYSGSFELCVLVVIRDDIYLYIVFVGDELIVYLVQTDSGFHWVEFVSAGYVVVLVLFFDESSLYIVDENMFWVVMRVFVMGCLIVYV